MSYLARQILEVDFGLHRGFSDGDVEHGGTRLLVDAISALDRNDVQAINLIRRASCLMSQSPPIGKASSGGLALWQIKRVDAHIDQRISQPIFVHELANIARLSTSYFSAAFKVSFQISPHNYIIVRRVEFAKTFMRKGDTPLSEIALECGLADQAHLSRVFRRVTGTTPSAWRRLHRDLACARENERMSLTDERPRTLVAPGRRA